MPIVFETGFKHILSHRGRGYSVGPVVTEDHRVLPGEISVRVGLARVQATVDGPFGAVIGIMEFGSRNFGQNPVNWETAQFGRVGGWTVALQVIKGDMSAWESVQGWR